MTEKLLTGMLSIKPNKTEKQSAGKIAVVLPPGFPCSLGVIAGFAGRKVKVLTDNNEEQQMA